MLLFLIITIFNQEKIEEDQSDPNESTIQSNAEQNPTLQTLPYSHANPKITITI